MSRDEALEIVLYYMGKATNMNFLSVAQRVRLAPFEYYKEVK